MQIVPLQPVPNQDAQALLTNQPCQIHVYDREGDLFFDLAVNNSPIITGRICENKNLLVLNKYFGFLGDFTFYDTAGTDDPVYTGLGTRFVLIYLEPDDIT